MDVKGIGNRDHTVGGRCIMGSIVGYKYGAVISEVLVIGVIVDRNHAGIGRIVDRNGTVVTTVIGRVAIGIRDKGKVIIKKVASGIGNDDDTIVRIITVAIGIGKYSDSYIIIGTIVTGIRDDYNTIVRVIAIGIGNDYDTVVGIVAIVTDIRCTCRGWNPIDQGVTRCNRSTQDGDRTTGRQNGGNRGNLDLLQDARDGGTRLFELCQ
jgi:hypothetical protein